MSRVHITSIDWSIEPDIAALERAMEILNSVDSRAGIAQLVSLTKRGSIMAMVNLGWVFAESDYVSRDWQEAEKWFQMALSKGSIEASFRLGLLYKSLDRFGEALSAFEFGADRKYSPSVNRIGMMYYLGLGVGRDVEKSIAYWRRAASLGHIKSEADLSNLYVRGKRGVQYIPYGIFLMGKVATDIIFMDKTSDGGRLR